MLHHVIEHLFIHICIFRLGFNRLHFEPYNQQQLQCIVSSRLEGLEVFQSDEIQLVSRKVRIFVESFFKNLKGVQIRGYRDNKNLNRDIYIIIISFWIKYLCIPCFVERKNGFIFCHKTHFDVSF